MSQHVSVLLPESIDLLQVKDGGIYLDLTLGRGGTSEAILKKLKSGHLYSFDLDLDAIKESEARLKKTGDNFTLIHGNYRNLKPLLAQYGVKEVDGITCDLGVSSPQFDEAERGFTYKEEAPLDMRMDQTSSLTAEKIVNTYSYEDLKRIFKEYGEDEDSASIARHIVKRRAILPIKTTSELVSIIKESKPIKHLLKKGHPAKQIFQALRIEVNDELGSLKEMLSVAPTLLKRGGVLEIITFHSLEDRLVKQAFNNLTKTEGNRHVFINNEEKEFELLTRKPVTAGETELENNNRAHSAKLRAIRRKEEKK